MAHRIPPPAEDPKVNDRVTAVWQEGDRPWSLIGDVVWVVYEDHTVTAQVRSDDGERVTITWTQPMRRRKPAVEPTLDDCAHLGCERCARVMVPCCEDEACFVVKCRGCGATYDLLTSVWTGLEEEA